MTLSEILTQRSNVNVECTTCGAHQAAHIPDMIAKHHPDTEFDTAAARHVCMFCGETGRFRYVEPTDWVAELKKRSH